jgi:hypothetical protein
MSSDEILFLRHVNIEFKKKLDLHVSISAKIWRENEYRDATTGDSYQKLKMIDVMKRWQ